jgi:hypothetical protein
MGRIRSSFRKIPLYKIEQALDAAFAAKLINHTPTEVNETQTCDFPTAVGVA